LASSLQRGRSEETLFVIAYGYPVCKRSPIDIIYHLAEFFNEEDIVGTRYTFVAVPFHLINCGEGGILSTVDMVRLISLDIDHVEVKGIWLPK